MNRRLNWLDRVTRRAPKAPAGVRLAPYAASHRKSMGKSAEIAAVVMEFWREQNVPNLDAIERFGVSGTTLKVKVPNASAKYTLARSIVGNMKRRTCAATGNRIRSIKFVY